MKIGFIGAGNMGGAILKGALSKGFLAKNDVCISDQSEAVCAEWKAQDIQIARSNVELIQNCEWIVLAVKPVFLGGVIDEIRGCLTEAHKVISIAAGWSIQMLREAMGESQIPLLRVMPNTPALVGEGVLALCQETTLSDSDFIWAQKLFATLGVVQMIPERMMDAVIAVSGSSPAELSFIGSLASPCPNCGVSVTPGQYNSPFSSMSIGSIPILLS